VQHSSSPSQASTPPRTIVAFADVVNFNRGAKVRVKNRNKGMQSTPLTIPPSSSPNSCGKKCRIFCHHQASPCSLSWIWFSWFFSWHWKP
jgi:hypothetical protein